MLPLCNLPITASQWWLIELGINDYKCTLWYKVKVSKFQIINERHMEYKQLENKQSYLNVHTILLLIIGVLLRSISNPRWWELRSGMKSCFSHLWEKKRKKKPITPSWFNFTRWFTITHFITVHLACCWVHDCWSPSSIHLLQSAASNQPNDLQWAAV